MLNQSQLSTVQQFGQMLQQSSIQREMLEVLKELKSLMIQHSLKMDQHSLKMDQHSYKMENKLDYLKLAIQQIVQKKDTEKKEEELKSPIRSSRMKAGSIIKIEKIQNIHYDQRQKKKTQIQAQQQLQGFLKTQKSEIQQLQVQIKQHSQCSQCLKNRSKCKSFKGLHAAKHKRQTNITLLLEKYQFQHQICLENVTCLELDELVQSKRQKINYYAVLLHHHKAQCKLCPKKGFSCQIYQQLQQQQRKYTTSLITIIQDHKVNCLKCIIQQYTSRDKQLYQRYKAYNDFIKEFNLHQSKSYQISYSRYRVKNNFTNKKKEFLFELAYLLADHKKKCAQCLSQQNCSAIEQLNPKQHLILIESLVRHKQVCSTCNSKKQCQNIERLIFK